MINTKCPIPKNYVKNLQLSMADISQQDVKTASKVSYLR